MWYETDREGEQRYRLAKWNWSKCVKIRTMAESKSAESREYVTYRNKLKESVME